MGTEVVRLYSSLVANKITPHVISSFLGIGLDVVGEIVMKALLHNTIIIQLVS
jgi:hypothetical protein